MIFIFGEATPRCKNMNLKEKTMQLIELRKRIDEYKQQLEAVMKPLQAERDILQNEILDIMKTDGQYSARFDFGTVAKATRKTLKIVDEKALMDYLVKEKLDKEYLETRVNKLFFDSMGKAILKEGKPIIGTQIQETNYISIKNK